MIIVGILSTIFSKAKGNKGTAKNNPFSVNNIDDLRERFNNKKTTNPPRQKSPIPSVKSENQPGNLESIEKKYLKIKQVSEGNPADLATPLRPELKQMEQVKKTFDDRKEEEGTVFLESPDAKILVNGIIWAEILGEPRSKKPYFVKNK